MKNKLLMTLTIVGLLLMSVQNFAQAPALGTAADFVLFSTVGAVGNTGISHVTGNVGTNSGAITGFGNVNGVMNTSNGATAAAAADLLIAYNQLNSAIPNYFPAPLLGNGQILDEGVYAIAGPTTLNNELTLDAQNDPDAVFIFQINGALSTAALSSVTLINGAQACNVFWKIEGLVDMATGTTMRGTVIANNGAININTDGVLEGRALSTSGAVNVSGVLAYTPIGCGSPVLMGPAAPDFASAACYAIFSGNGPVSNAGITNVIGDVGTNVGLTTGFDPLLVNGMIHPIPDGSTAAAAADLLNAYNYLNTLPFDIELLYPAQFGNDLVLTPHTYLLNAATTFTGDLYLNAGGQADAVFVIQINGALTTSTYANVILMDGTKPENVFWKVDGAVSINDYSNFVGTIVANNGAVDLTTGVILEGRAFTTTGALSTASVTVNMPPGCGVFTSPIIINQPEDQTVCVGESVSLTVVASGLDLTYQWRKGLEELTDGGNLSGTNSNVFTINPAGLDDAASDYNVVVSGTYSPDAISEDVSLTVQLLPENVSAGFDANTCATCPYTFFEATAENYSSLLWTTSGDGEFDDDTALNPVYTPGLTDPGTTVILCLSVAPLSPCDVLNVEDCMELEVLLTIEPSVNAGDDQSICDNQVAYLVGEAQNYSMLLWSTSGDGEFSAPISLITTYTPGADDILAGTVELCLTAELILPGTDPAVDCMILTILGLPSADAGIDATVCATCPYSLLDATAENYSSLLWTTSGDGEFNDATTLHPVYTPGLTDPGTTVVLCLTANTTCNPPAYQDCMELVVEPGQSVPVANAGDDQGICEDQFAELAGEAVNYTSVLWSTGGDGIFSSPNSLITNYTPGPLDILDETVELCLTATLAGGVTVTDVDCLILTIYILPSVNAGNNIIACSTQEIVTNPTVNNYQQIHWITSGDGYFENSAIEITNYIPGANDLLQGQVDLCLVAYGVSPPCISVVMDCLQLFLESTPVVDAGFDFSVCEGDDAQLTGTAENYSELLWTTQGDGVFDDATIVNPVYTPGAEDITNGSVGLCLTATGNEACEQETAIACMVLSIIEGSTISGLDTERILDCSDYDLVNHVFLPLELFPVIENADAVLWTTTGDGYFDDETMGNAVYHLGSSDVWSGGFTLCLEITQGLCSSSAEACINIIVPIQVIPIEVPLWNGISSYVEMSSLTVPQVMAPVFTQLNFMLNSTGKYYWANAVPPINQLGNWMPIGYKAKFNSPACLPLYGDVVTNQSFFVSGAFTFLPVLTNVPSNIELLLGANASKVTLIYDWSSGMVWTNAAADLQSLTPGKAYLLVKKVASTSFNINFPAFDLEYFTKEAVAETNNAFTVANSPWNEVKNTSQPHIILFADESLNDLQAGDMIGAFNENGLCVGVKAFESNDNFNKLIVLGNDPFGDGIDGYLQGEKMNFKLYRPGSGSTSDINFTYDPEFLSNDGTFEVNGVSSVTKITITLTTVNDLTGQTTVQVFPNPAKDLVTITSNARIGHIKLVNLTGQLLLDLPVNGTEIQVNVSEYLNGMYFLQIETLDGFTVTKRLIIK